MCLSCFCFIQCNRLKDTGCVSHASYNITTFRIPGVYHVLYNATKKLLGCGVFSSSSTGQAGCCLCRAGRCQSEASAVQSAYRASPHPGPCRGLQNLQGIGQSPACLALHQTLSPPLPFVFLSFFPHLSLYTTPSSRTSCHRDLEVQNLQGTGQSPACLALHQPPSWTPLALHTKHFCCWFVGRQ